MQLTRIIIYLSLSFITIGCKHNVLESIPEGQLQMYIPFSSIAESENAEQFQVLLSITDEDSIPVLSNTSLGLKATDSGYVTETVILPEGSYIPSSAVILDENKGISMFVPLRGSVVAAQFGTSLGSSIQLSPGATNAFTIEPLSPQTIQYSYYDFGYTNYGNWTPQAVTPPSSNNELQCLMIGGNKKYDWISPIDFSLYNKEERIASGTASGNSIGIEIPVSQQLELTAHLANGDFIQSFTKEQLKQFTCESNRFIDLLYYDQEAFKKRQEAINIRFWIQNISNDYSEAFVIFIDSEGNVFKAHSNEYFIRTGTTCFAPFDSDFYNELKKEFHSRVGAVHVDSLQHYYGQLSDVQDNLPEPYYSSAGDIYEVYAIEPTDHHSYRASLINACSYNCNSVNSIVQWLKRNNVFNGEMLPNRRTIILP